MNAKDYGIPQNRERVFIVSIIKDVDNGTFEFPAGFPLQLRLKDMLEEVVDEKYYLNNEQIIRIKTSTFATNARRVQEKEWYDTLCARDYKDPKCVSIQQVAQMYPNSGNPQAGRIYDAEGISPAMDTCQGGNRMPKIVEPNVLVSKRTDFGKAVRKQYEAGKLKISRHKMTEMVPREDGILNTLTTVQKDNYVVVPKATKKGYAEAVEGDSINLEQPNSKTRRGRVGHGVAQTITTSPQQAAVMPELRVRKLTPKECFRLMGFDDEDFEKAAAVNSNSQLYKQAGNSIVVDVLEHLLPNVFKAVE